MAASYLKKKGYNILEKNFRFGKLEVDIIAEKGGTIVFFEVKRRSRKDWGSPSEYVDGRKQKRIETVARYYMAKNRLIDTHNVRFDVISIVGKEIEHIEGAFREH